MLAELIEKYGVTATAKQTGSHTETVQSVYKPITYRQDDWRVTLRMDGRQMTVDFHMGDGHGGKAPTAYDVLYCLVSDACGYEEAHGFEDWCNEYGYDTDSRTAEAAYRAIGKQIRSLHRLLGGLYDGFLFSELD